MKAAVRKAFLWQVSVLQQHNVTLAGFLQPNPFDRRKTFCGDETVLMMKLAYKQANEHENER